MKIIYEPDLHLGGERSVFRVTGILATSDQILSVESARELHAKLKNV